MILSTILTGNNPLIFLGGIGGLILLITLLILYLKGRQKCKSLSTKNALLNTEVLQLKTEIRNKNKSINNEIANKTKKLIEEIENRKTLELKQKIALKKAEEASFLRNTFLANMSHEIRTPLNGIIGFSHLLINEAEYQEKPELVNYAKNIAESGDRLLILMEHIIDISRIDANDFDIKVKAFEANTIINNCVNKVQKSISDKGLNLEYHPNDVYVVKGDIASFEKSLDLILDNAIRYTLNGKITIELLVNKEGNQLQVKISDTGIGIDKNFLPSIFEAFRQESTGYSRLHQGAGLGLPLAQRLMRLMKGDVKLRSQKGIGTQVSLLLNLAEKKKASSEQGILIDEDKTMTIEATKAQPHIFIVEDDKMNRMVFKKMLADFAQVQMAVDGEDAFEQLKRAKDSNITFDIILLDINLPNPWDGRLLLKEFKKRWPQLKKVPFIAQTAYAMTGDKEKFLAIGFDDYISKPIDKKELFTIIENNLRKFSA